MQYVCGRVGNEYESVGVTHGKRTKGVNNIPLKKNPNTEDEKPAYVRPKLTRKNAKDYGKRLNGLGLSAEDKKTVWELIEKKGGCPKLNSSLTRAEQAHLPFL